MNKDNIFSGFSSRKTYALTACVLSNVLDDLCSAAVRMQNIKYEAEEELDGKCDEDRRLSFLDNHKRLSSDYLYPTFPFLLSFSCFF